MTQTKFEQKNFFTPQAEGKPYDPYTIPIHHITDALRRNKEEEWGNYANDKAQGLENMRIEHEAAVAMTKHNNSVAKINAETKMEQFTNFSQGAFQLASIGLQAQAEQQKKDAYKDWSLFKIGNPDEAEEIMQRFGDLVDQNGRIINQNAATAYLKRYEEDSVPFKFVEKLLNASGRTRQVWMKATLGDKVANIPKWRTLLAETFKLSEDGPTLNELIAEPNKYGTEKERDELYAALSSGIDTEILDTHFTGLYDPKVISAKVDPAFAALQKQSNISWADGIKFWFDKEYIENKRKELKSDFDGSLGQKANYTALESVKNVRDLASKVEGTGTDSEKMSTAWENQYLGVLELVYGNHISVTQAWQWAKAEFEVKGQGTTSISKWRKAEADKVGFFQKLEDIIFKDIGESERNAENWMKVGVDAVQEHNVTLGPVSTEAFELLVGKIVSKTGKRESDVRKELREAGDTEGGLNVSEGISQLEEDSLMGKKKLDPADYLHLPWAARKKGWEKGYFHEPKNVVPATRQTQYKKDFINVGKEKLGQTEWKVDSLEAIRLRDNAYDKFEELLATELDINPNRDAPVIHKAAHEATLKYIETNFKSLSRPKEKDQQLIERRQILNADIDRYGSESYKSKLQVYEHRIKEVIPIVQAARQRGDKRPLSQIIPRMYTDEDGERELFFDPLWREGYRKSKSDRHTFLESQLLANGYNDQTGEYKPSKGELNLLENNPNGSQINDGYHQNDKDIKIEPSKESDAYLGTPFSQLMSTDTTSWLGFQINKNIMKRVGLRPNDVLDEDNRHQLIHHWTVINDPNFKGWIMLPGIMKSLQLGI